MGGCLKSIGCLVVAAALAVGGWITRDVWMPLLHRYTERAATTPASAHQPGTWEPATTEGAARAREAIEKLASRNGPVYANIEAGDLTAFIIQQLSHQLPESARNVEAMMSGDQLLVRCTVNPNDLGALSQH